MPLRGQGERERAPEPVGRTGDKNARHQRRPTLAPTTPRALSPEPRPAPTTLRAVTPEPVVRLWGISGGRRWGV
ncbi:hypothetical protein Asi02nite_62110 [Asanoa siamensis]|uniref:Uncharacterized protein n=1 Tax=Asanoa siamensis TaxID=926357 RepID=A0ABQ4CZG7_9ACTN|nr:hypothetical protein Asi02nite_62110 [Asanoa siamensis]